MPSTKHQPTVFILSISSDIGFDLAERYLAKNYQVVGTYRRDHPRLRKLGASNRMCTLIECDILKKKDIQKLIARIKRLKLSWDTWISCVGEPRPLTPFFKTNFEAWSRSFLANALEQLRVLHAFYPFRNRKKISDVVFFAAGGTNNAVVNMSAYTIGKIMLIKMCEFLDAENDDLNIFIVGPGWTRTKTHDLILKDKNVSAEKYRQTMEFIRQNQGTRLEDIFQLIGWLCQQGKPIAGGRNFSVVHDPWRSIDGMKLAEALRQDSGMYKLKRHRNEFNT